MKENIIIFLSCFAFWLALGAAWIIGGTQ